MAQTMISSVRMSGSYVVSKYNIPSTTYNPLPNTRICHVPPPSQPQRRLSVRRLLCVRATTQVNGFGSIDSPLMLSMQTKIREQLNAESVSVKDAYGDGRHVSIDVISSSFEGQSAVNRQRMVYKAIWAELQNTVHAVDQMTTRTPAEAGIETQ